jgi:hypothetical protein
MITARNFPWIRVFLLWCVHAPDSANEDEFFIGVLGEVSKDQER